MTVTPDRPATTAPSSPGYRPGWLLVLGTVLASALLCAATVGSRPSSGPVPRAAQSLEQHPLDLGAFAFQERSGSQVSQADLADRVWVAAFIFTRCPSSCPRISSTMKGMQGKLQESAVRLVSISVDPKNDTPDVLARYANGLGADADRWWFLTGDQEITFRWIRDRFQVPVQASSEADIAAGAEAFAHSSKLALIDRGNRVIGYYNADDPIEVEALLARAHKLDNVWAQRLPSINATLNGLCAVVLLLGWVAILNRRTWAHAASMFTALTLSAVFLTCYLVYHFLIVKGSVPFQGVGRPIRVLYFSILLSHTVLAVVLVPLIAITVFHVLKRRFDRHSRIARVTFPVWLYVSVTGVVVYWMLYRLDFASIAVGA